MSLRSMQVKAENEIANMKSRLKEREALVQQLELVMKKVTSGELEPSKAQEILTGIFQLNGQDSMGWTQLQTIVNYLTFTP